METLEQHLPETTRRERRRIARLHFRSRAYARFFVTWQRRRGFAGADAVRIDGLEHIDRALAEGHGVILATAHFGHAHLIKPLLALRGRDALLVAEPSPRWQGAAGSDLKPDLNLRPCLAALARNDVLITLSDGHVAQALHRLPIGGIDIFFAPGAVSLARETGAAVLPTFVVDEPSRIGPSCLRLAIHPPLEIRATDDRRADLEVNLRRFARAYEQQLRTHPHNFHWKWVRDGVFWQPGTPGAVDAERSAGAGTDGRERGYVARA